MSTVLEVDESGALKVPAAMLPSAVPRTRYVASVEGNQLLIMPEGSLEPFYQRATPEERAADILEWATQHPDSPGLPDEAVGRDAIYD